jgi:peptidoglycan/LPS O-acetylase OafA/YrhL
LVCAGLAAVPLLIRLRLAASGSDLGNVFYWTHTRLDSILWGSILALWQNPAVDKDPWRPKLWQFGAALLALAGCLVIRSEVFRETLRYTIQGAALFVVFSYVLQDRSIMARVLGSSPLRFIALISYTLYLAHMPALGIAEHLGWPMPVLTGLCLAFAYAIAMRVIVERPLQRMRRSHL